MSESLKRKKEEQRLRGIRVSEGIGIGHVLRLHTGTQSFYRIELQSSEVELEIERLRKGVELARHQLLEIKARAEKQLGTDHAYIFDAHILMLKDRRLIDEMEGYIRQWRVNAEWAAKVAVDGLLAVYAEIKDDYLRARGSDIEDVGQRITAALAAQPAARDVRSSAARASNSDDRFDYSLIPADAVIVAQELPASIMAELDLSRVRAIATDGGGWTAHTAIIARSMGIPAVVGLRDVYARARTGDQIIVDAVKGEAVLNPLSTTLDSYSVSAALSISNRNAQISSRSRPGLHVKELLSPDPLLTKDGIEIILRANVEFPAEFVGVRPSGARGIGLYRSEFLISPRGELPDEEEQYSAYKGIAELAEPDHAVIRLFDIGSEKVVGRGMNSEESNPALGLRAIRFCLQHEDVMRTQIRAILRAATET
ncbi:MAG: putative PEP-binding protein, partial [Pyrinomonadaceae bacterium]